MISEKTLDIFVAVGLFIVALFAVGAIMAWGLGKSGLSVGDQQSEGPSLVEKNGFWVVENGQRAKSIAELEEAPGIKLLPYRQEYEPAVEISAERESLARSVERFLRQWESFSPDQIRSDAARGNPDPYRARLQPWVSPDHADDLAARIEASDPPGVGVNKSAGLEWISAGQVDQALKIGEIENNRAWVWISGLVRYEASPGDNNRLDGQLINRVYSLLLQKQSGRWLVYRAVVDPGWPLGQ